MFRSFYYDTLAQAEPIEGACVQVDLNTSSIRPGKPPTWFESLRQNTLDGVSEAATRGVKIHVHCGSWLHDVDQVLLEPREYARSMPSICMSMFIAVRAGSETARGPGGLDSARCR